MPVLSCTWPRENQPVSDLHNLRFKYIITPPAMQLCYDHHIPSAKSHACKINPTRHKHCTSCDVEPAASTSVDHENQGPVFPASSFFFFFSLASSSKNSREFGKVLLLSLDTHLFFVVVVVFAAFVCARAYTNTPPKLSACSHTHTHK